MPKPSSTTIATLRSRSSGSPSAEIRYTSATVENVNEATSPATIPSGRLRPPEAPAANTTGSTGSTQGDSAVPAPATNPKTISSSICS